MNDSVYEAIANSPTGLTLHQIEYLSGWRSGVPALKLRLKFLEQQGLIRRNGKNYEAINDGTKTS